MAIAVLSMPVPESWGGEVGAGLCQVVIPAGGQKREGGREGEDPPTLPLAMSDLIPLAEARAGLELQDSPILTSLIDQPLCPQPESLSTLSHRKDIGPSGSCEQERVSLIPADATFSFAYHAERS